jgi:hypothetical protein
MAITSAPLHAAATQSGLWISYSGTARMVLAVVLLAAAGSAVYAGARLRRPLRLPRPSEAVRIFMLGTWFCAILAFLIGAHIYVLHARREHLLQAAPANNVTPVTAVCVVVIFMVILIAGQSHGGPVALVSAVIGAAAAPWVFEVPFDLIVMTRTYPALPPDPALYRALFFAPLVLVGLTTLALLALSPMVRLSRAALFCIALMLAIYAVWALTAGFAYPSAPIPYTLNVASKIVAFAAAVSLFLPGRASASATSTADEAASTAGTPDQAVASLPITTP